MSDIESLIEIYQLNIYEFKKIYALSKTNPYIPYPVRSDKMELISQQILFSHPGIRSQLKSD